MQLLIDVADVCSDGVGADEELVTDCFGAKAGAEQIQHFLFTGAKCIGAFCQLRGTEAADHTARDGGAHG